MSNLHHWASPSKLDRIAACPGSGRACAGVESVSGDYAKEGDMLHGMMAAYVEHGKYTFPKGYSNVGDQVECIDKCIAYFKIHFADCEWIAAEKHVKLIGPDFDVLTEGTMDVVGQRKDGTLIVLDWKFGRKWVNPNGRQLKAYAAASMQTFGADICEAHIFQPRAGDGKPILFTDREQLEQEVGDVIAYAESADAPFCAGDHCHYCPAKHDCIAYRSMSSSVEVAVRNISALSNERIGDMAAKAKEVKSFCEEVIKECKRRTLEGEDTGHRIIEKKGNRGFTDIQKVYDSINTVVSLEEVMALTSVSVSKLENLYASKRKDEDTTKKKAVEEFNQLVGEYIKRGNAKKEMVKENS